MTARDKLNEIKEYLGVSTDQELADRLNTNKRSVESWVKRDRIPDKWRMIMEQMYQKDNFGYKNQDNLFPVPLLSAGAGEGIYNFDNNKTLLSLNPTQFPYLYNQPITAIQIDGDSMEPTLRQGDFILITPAEDGRQTEDGIYAIRIDGMIKVKSLQFLMDGTIKIISDNTKYEIEIYNPKKSQVDFQIIGKQRLLISR